MAVPPPPRGFYRWKKCADWYLLIHLFSLVRNKFYCQPWLSVCTYNLLETISAGWKSNNYLRSIHQSHKYKTNIFLSFFFLLSLAYVLQKPCLFLVVINVRTFAQTLQPIFVHRSVFTARGQAYSFIYLFRAHPHWFYKSDPFPSVGHDPASKDRCHSLVGQWMLFLGAPLSVSGVLHLVPKGLVGKQSHFCFSNSGH